MQNIKQWVTHFSDAWQSWKSAQLSWRADNQAQQLQLQQQHLLADNALTAQLKKRSLQLEHELALLKTEQAAQLQMFKTKCRQDVNDYQQYLKALDRLKGAIQNSYTHLPDAIAFTIHHHAKQLLNAMWEAKNIDEKIHHELHLIRFMSTVQEEARLHSNGQSPNLLPEKTLQMLERH